MDPYHKPWLIEALNKAEDKKPIEGAVKSLPIKGTGKMTLDGVALVSCRQTHLCVS